MGYFSNGSEGDYYEAEYCARCVHYGDGETSPPCAVLEAHMVYNYDECNNEDSVLHILIPRDDNGENMQCRMFIPKEAK